MPNHVHLLLTPEEDEGPSRMMQLIGRHYVPYVNSRVPRTGTLWEGRYRSSIVNSDRYFFTCSRYIELNPVRAGMTDDPGHCLWSSYLHNARGVPDPLIAPHDLYQRLAIDAAGQQAAYRALFDDVLKPEMLDAIRQAARRGDLLGDSDFRQKVEVSLHRPLPERHHGGDRRSDAFQASRRRAATPPFELSRALTP
jgi:putative transposase